NHEILVLKKPKPSLFKKIDSSKKEWIKSQDLNKEYFLLFPISEFGDNIINNDLCRLIGYYAAEGCIMYEGRKENRKFKGIQFAFHKEEDDFINDVNNIIKNLYGLDSKIKKFKDTNQCVIRIFSQKIAEDMNNFVPGLAGTKKLHSILMSLNKECTKHLLSGFIRGDGGIYDRRSTFCTKSKDLAYQLFTLFSKFKAIPQFNKNKNTISTRDQVYYRYLFSFSDGSKKIFDKIYNLDDIDNKIASRRIIDNYACLSVNNIEEYQTTDKTVYNLSVEDDETFCSSFIVHNCSFIHNSPFRPIYKFGWM